MSLESKLSQKTKEKRPSLTLPVLTFSLASLTDMYFTLRYGNELGGLIEGNPLISSWIELLGEEMGVYLPKALLGLTVISAAVYVDNQNKAGKTSVKGSHILYGGSFVYCLAASSWLVLKTILT